MPKMSIWQTNEIPTLLNIASEIGCVNIDRFKEQCQICMIQWIGLRENLQERPIKK
jgi:hypothetical protein